MSLNLNLNNLLTFIVVAETLSFRAAAEQQNTSQSVVSSRVRNLEERLGVRLFHRTTRSVKLTDEGRQLFTVAKASFADIENVIVALRKEATLQSGEVTLAAVPSISQTVLPAAMAAFRDAYPGIKLSLLDVDSKRCLDMLNAGEADLAIVSDLDKRRNVVFEPLFRDECFLVVPKNHVLAGRSSVSLKDTVGYPLMVSPRGTTLREIIDQAFAACGATDLAIRDTWNMPTLVRLVEEGFGLGIVPHISLSRLDLSQCATLKIRERVGRTIGIAHMATRAESPGSTAFRQLLRDMLILAPLKPGAELK
jgi:DNA-binding transcriptional LysR family regulator